MVIRGKISKIELAYIAGLFDGEGHIFVYKVKQSNTYVLSIGITNTYKDVIEWIYKLFPSAIQQRTRYPNHPNWKPCFFWSTTSDKAKDFLKMIYPYLRIKKEQARLGIDLQEKWQKHQQHKNGRFQETPKEIIKKREWYKQQIHNLNTKKSPAETKRMNIS